MSSTASASQALTVPTPIAMWLLHRAGVSGVAATESPTVKLVGGSLNADADPGSAARVKM